MSLITARCHILTRIFLTSLPALECVDSSRLKVKSGFVIWLRISFHADHRYNFESQTFSELIHLYQLRHLEGQSHCGTLNDCDMFKSSTCNDPAQKHIRIQILPQVRLLYSSIVTWGPLLVNPLPSTLFYFLKQTCNTGSALQQIQSTLHSHCRTNNKWKVECRAPHVTASRNMISS